MRKLPKPKRLNLEEIWKLYLIFQPALEKSDKKYLIDEVEFLIENSPKGSLLRAVKILYKKPVDQYDPMELLIMFINGIKKNNFFTFCEYIRRLSNGNAKQ